MNSYLEFKSGIPLTTYIQSAREDFKKFLVFCVEYWKDGYKSNFVPPSSQPTVVDKAKDLCKYLIGIIESHEQKRVVKLQIEFMLSASSKIWLSHLDFCQMATEEFLASNSMASVEHDSGHNNSNELLEIINELDSPKHVQQRRPSVIKKLEKPQKVSDLIKIASPDSDFDSELSHIMEEESFLGSQKVSHSSSKKEERSKISKNYLELVSKTRVKAYYPRQKILISDEEFRDEYKKLVNYFSASPKGTHDFHKKKPFEYTLMKSNTIRTPLNKEKSMFGSLEFIPVRKQSFNVRREIYTPILSQRKPVNAPKKSSEALQMFTNTQLIFSNNYHPGNRVLSPYSNRDLI